VEALEKPIFGPVSENDVFPGSSAWIERHSPTTLFSPPDGYGEKSVDGKAEKAFTEKTILPP